MSDLNLDKLLKDLGHFGKYQKQNYFLICLLVVFSCSPMSYIFTTRDLNYRCRIEECDQNGITSYEADWVKHGIPFKNDIPARCEKFQFDSNLVGIGNDTCTVESFDRHNNTIYCDDFVYETQDITVGRDFNITCDNNLWKLTIIGTINNIGELLCSPVCGYFSDRYGRKTLMIVSVLWTTFAGLLKSFTTSYGPFVALEFLDTAIGSGFYSAGFVLAMELVTPEQRVIGNTILACAFAAGEALLGVIAWISPSWRVMLRILYGPGILFISYIWLTHESVRWLLSKGRNQEAKEILKQVAKINGTEVSEEVIIKLNKIKEEEEDEESIFHIFRSPRLLLRLISCSYAWISCTFVYYGLTLHSVSISGNIYVNYITVAAVEVPAYFLCNYTLNKIGRRLTLAPSFVLSGLSCLLFIFVPSNNYVARLILFLLGKFFVTVSYTVLYMYTTEMFPTRLRHSLLATCSMFGRFGSMVAPQVPLLVRVWDVLPLLLFSIMACSSGMLSFLFPETNNVKLPDTIEEAVDLGKNETNSIIK